jgi:hypothetical protein
MRKKNKEKNRLVIACPFSSREDYLLAHFGRNILIHSSFGGVSPFADAQFSGPLAQVISHENIGEIFLVMDTTSDLTRGIIDSTIRTESYATSLQVEEYLSNFFKIESQTTAEEKVEVLCQLSLVRQIQEFMENPSLAVFVENHQLALKAVVGHDKSRVFTPVNLHHPHHTWTSIY